MSSVQPLHALNLDQSQQQSFIRYFRGLSEKPSTTIRIFNRVDYYTVHDEDARFAAQEVFKSSAVVKRMGVENLKLDYLVLSKSNFEKFVRTLLLVKHYQVEVYNNRGSNKNNDWALQYKGSPGNLTQFEEVLFDNSDVIVNSIVMAVKMSANMLLGISCIDSNGRTFSVCELMDNEFFSHLESLIVQLSPRECLVQINDKEKLLRLQTILQRSNILYTPQKSMEFSINSIAQDLDRLLHFEEGQQEKSIGLPEMDMKNAMASLHSAIKYLELTADRTYFNKFTIKILDTKRYVHLDNAAVKALNLLPNPNNPRENKNTSILGLLDRCRTPQGRRMLMQWIRQPLRDINALNDRLDMVEVFVNNNSLRHVLHNDHLRRIPDMLMLSKKMLRNKAKLQDIYRVYQAIDKLPHMVAALRSANNKTIKSMFVDNLSEYLSDMEKYQKMIESTLDMDLVDKGEFLVKTSFDEELAELQETRVNLEEKIQDQLNVAARDLCLESGKTIKLDFTDQLGYFLRVTLKEEPVLRKNKKYKIMGAVKGGVRFTTDTLENYNDEYLEIRATYEKQQQNVVSEIMVIAAGYVDTLNSINYLLAQLDVLVSFAIVSSSAPKPFVRPRLLPEGSGYTKFVQVRHPCVEVQDGVSYNPNDIEFKQGESTFHIITGPNMGGKSTYIRSVGVAAFMAHIGCFVPCDVAELSLCDSILARMGSEDCLAKGLSTFMLEMVETAGILRTVTENSLVIIDELGRGTSTYEGCGIAWAIAEHLAKEAKAFSMFATHFHELTKLADEVPTVINKHVTALISDNTLTLLYQVRPGICDQSFGIHVAKMANFPDDFIQHATQIQHTLEDFRHYSVLADCDPSTRMRIVEEGDALIAEFLKKCKSLDVEHMSDEEIENAVNKFRSEIKAKNNPYVLALLTE